MNSTWEKKKLNEVVWFQEGPGVRKHQYSTKGIKLLNVRNLVKGSLILDNTEVYISNEEGNGRYKHFLVDEGDLIIGSSGIKVEKFEEKVAFVEKRHLPLCMNTSTIRFKTLNDNILNIKFFSYFLKSRFFKEQIQFHITGSAQLNFGPSHLNKMTISLPPLEYQQRIVNILDKAEEIRTKKKLANEKLDEFLKSTFIDMFGDPVTNPKGYNIELIKNIGTVVTGNTPPRTNEEYYGNYIEWIKSDNINTPYTYLTKAEEYLSELGMQKGRVVPKNSILVTCIAGSFNCIGNVALTDRPVAFNQQINAIIPEKKYINSAFLYEHLYIGKKLIQEKSTNSMKGMVSKSKFETIKLILPDLKEQELFEKIFVEVEKQKEKNQKVIEQMDNLFNSLMQQAFNHN